MFTEDEYSQQDLYATYMKIQTTG